MHRYISVSEAATMVGHDLAIRGWELDLRFAQKFVQAHNGTISVKSEKGRDSTFTVKLPIDCKR